MLLSVYAGNTTNSGKNPFTICLKAALKWWVLEEELALLEKFFCETESYIIPSSVWRQAAKSLVAKRTIIFQFNFKPDMDKKV